MQHGDKSFSVISALLMHRAEEPGMQMAQPVPFTVKDALKRA